MNCDDWVNEVFYLKMIYEEFICSDIFLYDICGKVYLKMYMNLGGNFLLERIGY